MNEKETEVMKHLNAAFNYATALQAELQHAGAVLNVMNPGGAPSHLRFDSPVGTWTERNGDKLWPGDWFDASPYANLYTSSTGAKAYHTGADLNRPGYGDVGQPVYAAANGEIVYSGALPGWQLMVVVIKHQLANGSFVWTRYAHISDVLGLGQVKRGQQIGIVGDYTPPGPAGDHVHFDVAKKDFGAHPDDWPGMSRERVLSDYYDPLAFLKDNHHD